MRKHVRTSTRRRGKPLKPDERRHAMDVFLEAFATSANLTAAARVANIDRMLVRYWQEHDLDHFAERYHEAEAKANDTIRAAIFQRAVLGVDKPLIYQGHVVKEGGKIQTVKDYSDSLLMFLAKSRMPEFREKSSIDVNATIDFAGLAEEAERRFAALLATAAAADV